MPIHSVRDLGQAVRQARKQAGLTQKDLAMASRVGVRFISDLENGKPTVEFGRALHVVNVLSMDLNVVERGSR
jgi:HTH-type transcriptional regulator/antitoxin HipB